jgi:ABC-type transport system involved in cytochrome bd biosynthesis fused ATPase/permease subunit
VNSITLYKTLPKAFEHNDKIISNVWLSEVKFTKNKSYLIQAKSGCGKTSLCSFLYGQRNDYIGNILFDNKNIKELTPTDTVIQVYYNDRFEDAKPHIYTDGVWKKYTPMVYFGGQWTEIRSVLD